ncbi:hypothetical protein PF008_g14127 [Phytophthora fragariae]|uniref:Uncharacterized protein n=1 Tax=Phytophthora fragariae TaxID=53985 RepID=A0A6G0RIG1_9STRA|nr:hypothetical protein PF008_g14127 [Phytophthora fragariae]
MAFQRKIYPLELAKPSHCVHYVGDLLHKYFQSVWSYWNRVQVGHRGRYSVERLLALNDYYQRTSLAHVVVVCSLGLLPAFVVAVLVECIPLRPPTESWRANYTFWIRLFVSSLPIAFGGVYQVKEVIQPGVISTTGIIATAFGSCACYVALTILVAALWKFPIPFGYVLTIGPFVVFYMVFFLLSIGPRVLVNSPALRRQIFSQMLVIAAQGLLAIAYPTFGAIFKQLSGHEQTAFVFVLPIIKFSIKQFIATVSSHLHEPPSLRLHRPFSSAATPSSSS